ncbi:hypothetical protein D3C87_1594820 [compost metagenome]
MFFYFTGYFVCQLNICMKRCVESDVVFFSVGFGHLWTLECVFFESQFELLTSVVLDRVKFCKYFTQTSLDEFTPRVFLVSDEIW